MKHLVKSLARRRDGAVAVEFALIAPFLLGVMLGVFQVGIGMQSYNALRAITADTARFAAIDAQRGGTRKTDEELETWVRNRATRAPYALHTANLTVDVTTDATPRIATLAEKSVTVTYTVDSVLSLVGVEDVTLTFTRPIFQAL
jgi:Flp pilus assembly protein TadG